MFQQVTAGARRGVLPSPSLRKRNESTIGLPTCPRRQRPSRRAGNTAGRSAASRGQRREATIPRRRATTTNSCHPTTRRSKAIRRTTQETTSRATTPPPTPWRSPLPPLRHNRSQVTTTNRPQRRRYRHSSPPHFRPQSRQTPMVTRRPPAKARRAHEVDAQGAFPDQASAEGDADVAMLEAPAEPPGGAGEVSSDARTSPGGSSAGDAATFAANASRRSGDQSRGGSQRGGFCVDWEARLKQTMRQPRRRHVDRRPRTRSERPTRGRRQQRIPRLPPQIRGAGATAEGLAAASAGLASTPPAERRDLAGIRPTAQATPPVAATTNRADDVPAPPSIGTARGASRIDARRRHRRKFCDPKRRPRQFVQRVAGAMQRAQLREGNVRVRLSPPELGSLRIELSLNQGVMTASVEAETSTAQGAAVGKPAAAAASGWLRRTFALSDLTSTWRRTEATARTISRPRTGRLRKTSSRGRRENCVARHRRPAPPHVAAPSEATASETGLDIRI